MKMRVLVVYASLYGATEGIAEHIAATLRGQGIDSTAQQARKADDPAGYDAFVVGSAAYYFRWMKHAVHFVRRYSDVLSRRPVWLFSSGPLGTEAKDAKGRDLRDVTVPKEIAEFTKMIKPRDHRVFFGAMDHSKLSLAHRLMLKLPANKDNAIFPEGDFRDWDDIEAWARSIAQALDSSVAEPVRSKIGGKVLTASGEEGIPDGLLAHEVQ